MHFVLTFTYKWGGGGGWLPPLPRGFLSFFLDDKTSGAEVFIRTHFETSLVMVCYNSLLSVILDTRYDVKPFLNENACSFNVPQQ